MNDNSLKQIKVILVIALCLIVVISLFFNYKINMLNNIIQNQNSWINNLSSNINSMEDSIYTWQQEKTTEEPSILDTYEISYGKFNARDLTMQVIVKATPKEYGDKTTAQLVLGNKVVDMVRAGSVFTGYAFVPITTSYYASIRLKTNDITQSYQIPEQIEFNQRFMLRLKAAFGGFGSYGDGKISFNGEVFVDFVPYENSNPIKAKIYVKANDVVLKEIDILHNLFNNNYSYIHSLNESFNVNNGEEVELIVEVTDSDGLTYKRLLSQMNSNGEVINIQGDNEVFDTKGNVIIFK